MGAPVVGLLLAAGAGRRMGGPKALVRGPDGTAWVERAARELRAAGCHPVRVVVGARAAEVIAALAENPVDDSVVDDPVSAPVAGPLDTVVAVDWAEGMGASLRAGIAGLAELAPAAQAALVHLVDLPDVGADVLARVAGHATPAALARAVYGGRLGHPVLLGRDHWTAVAAAARGDAGARDYLAGRDVLAVECGDLAAGADVDTR